MRMAEFGSCHRYEPSGALHGIMRVRGFVQDDAHIFCSHDQITPETTTFCRLLLACYKDLGFEDVRVKLATRPENRIGSDAVWDQAEKALAESTAAAGLDTALNPGEGALLRSQAGIRAATRLHRPRLAVAAPCRWTSIPPSGWARATSPPTATATRP